MLPQLVLLVFGVLTAVGLFAIQILSIPRSDQGTSRARWRRRWVLMLLPIGLAIPYLNYQKDRQSSGVSTARHEDILEQIRRVRNQSVAELDAKYPYGYETFGPGKDKVHHLTFKDHHKQAKAGLITRWDKTKSTIKDGVARIVFDKLVVVCSGEKKSEEDDGEFQPMEMLELTEVGAEIPLELGHDLDFRQGLTRFRDGVQEELSIHLEVIEDDPANPVFVLGLHDWVRAIVQPE